MYLDFYGLKEEPFSITPDPRYVFLSERHRDALAHLLYGVGKGGGGGFVQLTGEVGTGKTTLCRLLLEQLPENTRVALILNPKLSPLELLEAICEELGIPIDGKRGSQKQLVDALNTFLLDAYAQRLRVVLIVDEAQNLSPEALEQVRLLTNLETPTQKLLQIILLGQPELRELLARPELRQLAQRITARYHLEPLDAEETAAYIRHRLEVAGLAKSPFSRLGLRTVYERSGGVPRLINIIADRALMAGFAGDTTTLGERTVQRAANEALPGHASYWWHRYGWWSLAVAVLLVIGLAGGAWLLTHGPAKSIEPAPVPAAAVEPHGMTAADFARILSPDGAARQAAWSYLLTRWQVRSEDVTVATAMACEPILYPGFHCLRGSGSLAQVARFDRPVLLLLDGADSQSAASLAVLEGVGEQAVRLHYRGASHLLQRAAFGQLWGGDFIALFRVPENMPPVLAEGAAGPEAGWVAEQLNAFDGGDAHRYGPVFFDAALEQRVRALQRGFGIRADGIVGPETQFALASLNSSGPHLARDVP